MTLRSVVGVVALLAVALWLRAADLGRSSFDTDEHYHLFAAQQLLQDGRPALPSGYLYTRSLPYTHVVALAFKWLGVSEASARWPSVVFGMLLVALTYLVGRRWLGHRAALVATALVATSPALVETSRLCRMYSVFQLLYLGIVFAYYQGWEQAGLPLRRRGLWTLLALGLGLASVKIHTLTMVVGPAIGAYWVGRAVAKPRGRYLLYLAVIAAGLAILFAVIGTGEVQRLWHKANYVPGWAAVHRTNMGFYLAEWQHWYPGWWAVLLAGAAVLLRRRPAIGWFLLCQFVVPFLLHSVVFDWKVRRYVSHLFPFLALLVAPLMVQLLEWAVAAVRQRRPLVWPRLAGGVVILAVLVAGWWPSLVQSAGLRDDPRRPRWRQAYAFLQQRLQPGDAVLVAVPLGAHHYLGHPATHAFTEGPEQGQRAVRNAAGVPVDWYSGLPHTGSLEAVQQLEAAYPRGWLVSNRGRFLDDAHTDPAVRRYVLEHWRAYHPIEGSTTVYVFGWDRTVVPEAGP